MTSKELKRKVANILNDLDAANKDGGLNAGDFISTYESLVNLTFTYAASEIEAIKKDALTSIS